MKIITANAMNLKIHVPKEGEPSKLCEMPRADLEKHFVWSWLDVHFVDFL